MNNSLKKLSYNYENGEPYITISYGNNSGTIDEFDYKIHYGKEVSYDNDLKIDGIYHEVKIYHSVLHEDLKHNSTYFKRKILILSIGPEEKIILLNTYNKVPFSIGIKEKLLITRDNERNISFYGCIITEYDPRYIKDRINTIILALILAVKQSPITNDNVTKDMIKVLREIKSYDIRFLG